MVYNYLLECFRLIKYKQIFVECGKLMWFVVDSLDHLLFKHSFIIKLL